MVSSEKDFAMFGISGAKEKNAAFPLPIKKAETAKSKDTKMMIAKAPKPKSFAKDIKISTKPTFKSPSAKT